MLRYWGRSVALIRLWDKGVWMVAPISTSDRPQLSGELMVDGMVLEIWNARTVGRRRLKQRPEVGRLSRQAREDAWALFANLMTGKELPEHVRARTGRPLRSKDDPRFRYQQAESLRFERL